MPEREGTLVFQPVGEGAIEALYVGSGSPMVLVYELSDGESAWGMMAGLTPPTRRPEWTREIPRLNLATPMRSDRTLLVAALAYAASIDIYDGVANWEHLYQYDGSGRTFPEISVAADVVRVSTSDGGNDTSVVCYAFSTGAIATCPSPPN